MSALPPRHRQLRSQSRQHGQQRITVCASHDGVSSRSRCHCATATPLVSVASEIVLLWLLSVGRACATATSEHGLGAPIVPTSSTANDATGGTTGAIARRVDAAVLLCDPITSVSVSSTSPNIVSFLGQQYGPSQSCVWVFYAADAEQQVGLSFGAFDVSYSRGCQGDSVQVWNGDVTAGSNTTTAVAPLLMGTYCGDLSNTLPGSVFTSSNGALSVRFQSDSGGSGHGLTMQYRQLPSCSIQTISVSYSDLPIDISLRQADSERVCSWRVEFVDDQGGGNSTSPLVPPPVSLAFTSFVAPCPTSLVIRNGTTPSAPVIWSLCGDGGPSSPFVAPFSTPGVTVPAAGGLLLTLPYLTPTTAFAVTVSLASSADTDISNDLGCDFTPTGSDGSSLSPGTFSSQRYRITDTSVVRTPAVGAEDMDGDGTQMQTLPVGDNMMRCQCWSAWRSCEQRGCACIWALRLWQATWTTLHSSTQPLAQ